MMECKSLFEAGEPFVVTLLDLLLKIHLGVLKQELRCYRCYRNLYIPNKLSEHATEASIILPAIKLKKMAKIVVSVIQC